MTKVPGEVAEDPEYSPPEPPLTVQENFLSGRIARSIVMSFAGLAFHSARHGYDDAAAAALEEVGEE